MLIIPASRLRQEAGIPRSAGKRRLEPAEYGDAITGTSLKALEAYNAGPGAVDKGHVPPESLAYALGIMGNLSGR